MRRLALSCGFRVSWWSRNDIRRLPRSVEEVALFARDTCSIWLFHLFCTFHGGSWISAAGDPCFSAHGPMDLSARFVVVLQRFLHLRRFVVALEPNGRSARDPGGQLNVVRFLEHARTASLAVNLVP